MHVARPDAGFVREARRLKALFGAAWRQAGIMAPAGLDRRGPRAWPTTTRTLTEGVAEILPGCSDPARVQTNIEFRRRLWLPPRSPTHVPSAPQGFRLNR
ncbi:hypothetical protein GCM10022214_05050 [Actinomadura miaoliensis]|uniref:Uncharacterized protein n=1 Tax=Actinomadura miaoliensis TaxID=430685 RepID=A0ABP7V0B5_9ACTN